MADKTIRISDYMYELPDERIAKYPLEKRDDSKLLVFKNGKIQSLHFTNLPELLPEHSLLAFNNTRVIQARLEFRKETGSRIEIFCLKPCIPADYQQVFSAVKTCSWICMVGNLKKWKDEVLEMPVKTPKFNFVLKARKSKIDESGSLLITFEWNSEITFAEVLEQTGRIPIPPYLNRESEDIDQTRYQTVYSSIKGSVAAPTAGLHFTPDVFDALEKKGIKTCELTLHVGAGTFQPVKSANAREHAMHGELMVINEDVINQLIENTGNITATGTTTMRTLESLYWLGVKAMSGKDPVILNQWEWEELEQTIPVETSLFALKKHIRNLKQPLQATTEIMIVPGYTFRLADRLITNFHQPGSTLLLLIAAFIGDDWKKVYQYALDNNYRFLSYGDSSLLTGK